MASTTKKRRVPIERGRRVTWRTPGATPTKYEPKMKPAAREVPDVYARVGVGGSVTDPVEEGSTSHVKVEVWIELPCAPDPASLRAAYKEAARYVDKWIKKEQDRAFGPCEEIEDDGL